MKSRNSIQWVISQPQSAGQGFPVGRQAVSADIVGCRQVEGVFLHTLDRCLRWGHPVRGGTFSRNPGLHPLDASGDPYPSLGTRNVS